MRTRIGSRRVESITGLRDGRGEGCAREKKLDLFRIEQWILDGGGEGNGKSHG